MGQGGTTAGMTPPTSTVAIGAVCLLAVAGVVARPFRLPEAVWAVAGAVALLALRLIPPAAALGAVLEGGDVYLFLLGAMLLSETARRHGLFDWVAGRAVLRARGSPARLFDLVFAVGVMVTTFLSNDATAVVLTPAVYAAARRGRVDPMPLAFACAFVANAASFVLPISNPANLVLYGGHTPALGAWLRSFAIPSILSIAATWGVLRLTQRRRLRGECAVDLAPPALSRPALVAGVGIAATALAILAASALDWKLGGPMCVAGVLTALAVQASARDLSLASLRGVSWSVLPLVGGLFVLVEALASTGAVGELAQLLARHAAADPQATAGWAGLAVALAANLVNNLPAGLIAAQTAAAAHPPAIVVDALLIGVDLGPNLSITGSLATILWLSAIRREGEDVTFLAFLKLGAVVTAPALTLALAARVLAG